MIKIPSAIRRFVVRVSSKPSPEVRTGVETPIANKVALPSNPIFCQSDLAEMVVHVTHQNQRLAVPGGLMPEWCQGLWAIHSDHRPGHPNVTRYFDAAEEITKEEWERREEERQPARPKLDPATYQAPASAAAGVDRGLIERLAVQAGIELDYQGMRVFHSEIHARESDPHGVYFHEALKPATSTQVQAFAALVAEECAKVASEWNEGYDLTANEIAAIIRRKFQP